jgi:hypothetical protein
MFTLSPTAKVFYDGSAPFAQTEFGTDTPKMDKKTGKQLFAYSVFLINDGQRTQSVRVSAPGSDKTVPAGFVNLKNLSINPYSKDNALAVSFAADAVEASQNG